MKTTLAIVAVTALVAAAPVRAQGTAFDAPAYLDRAIAIVRDKALDADRVDWPALSARVHAEGDGARDAFDTYPVLVTLLRGLGDRHSFLQLSAERAAAYRAAKGTPFRYPPATGADALRRVTEPRLNGRPVGFTDTRADGRLVRAVVVPTVEVGKVGDYAERVDAAIGASPAPCGYVIDLRGNQGGNMWPMLAGVSKLLGDRDVGRIAGRDPAAVEHWVLARGAAGLRDAAGKLTIAASVDRWRAMPGGTARPVALLTDAMTGSSGELVAVAFSGRAETRRFGGPTAGASTATEGFMLPDGANLVIVTAIAMDRTGRRFPAGLEPDEAVTNAEGSDAPLARARDWVASRCAVDRLQPRR